MYKKKENSLLFSWQIFKAFCQDSFVFFWYVQINIEDMSLICMSQKSNFHLICLFQNTCQLTKKNKCDWLLSDHLFYKLFISWHLHNLSEVILIIKFACLKLMSRTCLCFQIEYTAFIFIFCVAWCTFIFSM